MICSQCAVTKELESLPEATAKRIKDLLAANDAPLGRERESLSDLMSSTQNYAIGLDTRIADLRATLENLLDQKVATEQRLRDLKVALHPIRTVPPEILAKIFDEAVSDNALVPLEKVRDGTFANSIDNRSPTCIVSQVSSAWRRTALKTQRLWSFVHVSFDRYPRNLSTTLFLSRFLAHSAEHSLHVILHATVDHPAMAVVLVAANRWRTAAVSFPPPIYRSWDVPALSFRSLERLHVHLQINGSHTLQDITPGHRRLRLDTPQLQVFSSDTAGACFLVMTPRFSHLKHFRQTGALDGQILPLHGISIVGPIVMVRSPLMTSALFHVSKAVPEDFYTQPMRNLIRDAYRNLRALRLCGTSTGYGHFFSKFTLPCLQLLSFEDSESGGDLVAFPSPLIAPTGQRLEQLKVPIHDANDTDSLVALLRTTPKLRRLELRTRTHFDVSHTIRVVLVDEKDLIPKLTELVLSSMDPDGMAVSGVFVEAIKHRRSGEGRIAKLQEVLVNYAMDVDADVETAFAGLLSDGLGGELKLHSDLVESELEDGAEDMNFTF